LVWKHTIWQHCSSGGLPSESFSFRRKFSSEKGAPKKQYPETKLQRTQSIVPWVKTENTNQVRTCENWFESLYWSPLFRVTPVYKYLTSFLYGSLHDLFNLSGNLWVWCNDSTFSKAWFFKLA
jgi:hypothetical protein